jgi:citrate lyase subunit beta/citryl-CoA lyase
MTRHGRLGLPQKEAWNLGDEARGPRPRMRSVLYAPADRGDRIQKALSDGVADVVVGDLEDAVAPDRKAEARRQLLAAWNAVPESISLRAVRINAWPSKLAEEDLEAVLPGRPDIVAVPKCEQVADLRSLDLKLKEYEGRHGFPVGSIHILAILETAAGVLSARELAGACKRILAVAFGAEDLAADAGLRRSKDNWEVMVPRSTVALAAAAAGVAALDMITADPRDLERTASEAVEARALGYSGKMCIHPLQVVAVHEAFRPTAQELDWARRVVAAVEKADIAAGGVVVVDGRMVDVPFIRQARRILADAEA